jgi:hypothetical protein
MRGLGLGLGLGPPAFRVGSPPGSKDEDPFLALAHLPYHFILGQNTFSRSFMDGRNRIYVLIIVRNRPCSIMAVHVCLCLADITL